VCNLRVRCGVANDSLASDTVVRRPLPERYGGGGGAAARWRDSEGGLAPPQVELYKAYLTA